MEIKEAFKILGINEDSNLAELNLTFRKLAKKYHPDFNKSREEWANERMTRLNLAYETALQYLTSPDKSSYKSGNFLKYYNRAKDLILEGIFIFYKYGLDNVHLRREGVRRIRYSDSRRYMEKGIKLLKDIFSSTDNPVHVEWSKTLLDFSTAFLKYMGSYRFFRPSGNSYEDRAYWHFHEGSRLLDDVIKQVLFGDMLPLYSRGGFYKKLRLSYEEFMIVLNDFSESSWTGDTIFRVYLIEMLTRVIKVFKQMVY